MGTDLNALWTLTLSAYILHYMYMYLTYLKYIVVQVYRIDSLLLSSALIIFLGLFRIEKKKHFGSFGD